MGKLGPMTGTLYISTQSTGSSGSVASRKGKLHNRAGCTQQAATPAVVLPFFSWVVGTQVLLMSLSVVLSQIFHNKLFIITLIKKNTSSFQTNFKTKIEKGTGFEYI